MSRTTQEAIYDAILSDEDARACRAIPESACKEVPGNFLTLLMAQFLTKIGDALINPKVTLPWILTVVGAPAFFISWLVPIRESGSLIPQLVIASAIRQLKVRKWAWVVGSTLQAIAVLLMAAIAMFSRGEAAGWMLIGALVLFSFARGMTSVAAKDVTGKTIPKNQRGRLNGFSASLAGFVTIGIGASLLFISFDAQSPAFYVAGLILAAVVWLCAVVVYAQVKEYAGETEGGKNGFAHAISQLRIITEDKQFLLFVLSRLCLLSTALSAPYYIAIAQENANVSAALLAFFVIASGCASLVSGPFWGRFADSSSRMVMFWAAGLSALCGVGLYTVSVYWNDLLAITWFIPAIYFCQCIAHDGVRVGRKTYLIDMAGGEKRTSYVSVSNTLIGFALLGLSLIGVLSQWFSLAVVLLVLAVLSVVAMVLIFILPEAE